MSATGSVLGKIMARLPSRVPSRVAVCQSGLAAVEFALILPIMVVLWIGGVEVTQALSVDRKLNNLASSIGDLTARRKKLSVAQVNELFDIAPGAMFPYSTNGLQMRLTAVAIDSDGNATLDWSQANAATTPYDGDVDLNALVPANLRTAGGSSSQIIMAEVSYTYTPAVGYVITGGLNLDDRMFFVPRLTNTVLLCTSLNPDVGCKPS
jgi:Flp pilus assembly protein TadG